MKDRQSRRYYKPSGDIKNLLTRLSESRLGYCRRAINRYADALAKMAHM